MNMVHRLDGLEPDNLLAILALLGVATALDAADAKDPTTDRWCPRIGWDLSNPPLRPLVHLRGSADQQALATRIDQGLRTLAAAYSFDGRQDVDYSLKEAGRLLAEAARAAGPVARERVDLLSSLMNELAESGKPGRVAPTPLCLLHGGGHQHFLERLNHVVEGHRGSNTSVDDHAARIENLKDTLFHPWRRQDDLSSSFRWDPKEDVRYALMAGDPTANAYKGHTQLGANVLAAIGLASLTVVPHPRGTKIQVMVLGGRYKSGGFEFAWPIWRDPATLPTIRALFSHPDLWEEHGLQHLGVEHVFVARRISVNKLMNFTRAEPLFS